MSDSIEPAVVRGKPAARRRARRFLLQSLYQQALSGTGIAEIEHQFQQDHDMRRTDMVYYHELLVGIDLESERLLEEIAAVIDRKLDDLNPVEMAILKLGTYELIHRIDIPDRVVINECIELAKTFGAAESHKYVNSVLDVLAGRHRQLERLARSPSV